MRDRALTTREEAQLLKAAQRVLLQGGFPNPERTGCPDKEILRAIAFRELSPEQGEDWIDHLANCTPCFREYTEFRREVKDRRRLAFVAIAAVVIVVVGLGLWRWRSSHPAVITAHNHMVADMRNRLILRGDQGTGAAQVPLVFLRGFDDVSFYLPEGSRAGTYEVAVFREELGQPLSTATGVATIENGVTKMNATLNLAQVTPGHYLLGIRLLEVSWSYTPLVIK